MPRRNAITHRLQAAQHARQAAVFRAADRAAYHADRALASLWRELLAVLRARHGFHADYLRALAVLRKVGPVSADVLTRRLAGLYYQAHAGAADAVLQTIPKEVLGALRNRQAGGADRGPDRRAVRLGLVAESAHAAMTEAGPGLLSLTPAGIEPAEPDTDLRDLLFPAPPEDSVLGWLAHLVRPADYAQVGGDADRRLPEDLARQVATDMGLGKSQREIARGLLPHLDGSRVRARRAARTLGLVAAHAGQRQAWAELGDLVIGYQVHATLDGATRPEHRRRDGTTYHREPGPGQKGLDEMPRPPLEADGSIAWCCRCYLTPILSA